MKTLLATLLLLLTPLSWAGFIHSYSFSVTAVNGPLEGLTGGGAFTYDDRGLGGQRVNGLRFDDFLFTWNGEQYDENDVLFGSVWLSQDGSIDFTQISTFLGNRCIAGNCGVSAGVEEWNMSFLGFNLNDFGDKIFRYGTTRDAEGFGIANGIVSVTYLGATQAADAVTQSVPEPGTLLLLLGGLALARLRR